jgi:hypothetical protein
MIHEEICTYEVCKLAKEKGFPQDVFGTCEMKSSCYLEDGRYYKDGCIYPIENAYTAPTQSLLQRWLREEKNIQIVIRPKLDKLGAWIWGHYRWTIFIFNEYRPTYYSIYNGDNSTYELALEDALAYSLKNLV